MRRETRRPRRGAGGTSGNPLDKRPCHGFPGLVESVEIRPLVATGHVAAAGAQNCHGGRGHRLGVFLPHRSSWRARRPPGQETTGASRARRRAKRVRRSVRSGPSVDAAPRKRRPRASTASRAQVRAHRPIPQARPRLGRQGPTARAGGTGAEWPAAVRARAACARRFQPRPPAPILPGDREPSRTAPEGSPARRT